MFVPLLFFHYSSLMYFLKAAFREFGFRELSGEVRKMIEKGVERGGGGGGELVLCVSLNGEDFVRVSLLHNNPSPAFFKLLLSSFLPPHPSFPSLLHSLFSPSPPSPPSSLEFYVSPLLPFFPLFFSLLPFLSFLFFFLC